MYLPHYILECFNHVLLFPQLWCYRVPSKPSHTRNGRKASCSRPRKSTAATVGLVDVSLKKQSPVKQRKQENKPNQKRKGKPIQNTNQTKKKRNQQNKDLFVSSFLPEATPPRLSPLGATSRCTTGRLCGCSLRQAVKQGDRSTRINPLEDPGKKTRPWRPWLFFKENTGF